MRVKILRIIERYLWQLFSTEISLVCFTLPRYFPDYFLGAVYIFKIQVYSVAETPHVTLQ